MKSIVKPQARSVIVSITIPEKIEDTILLVGERNLKKPALIDIINAITGQEAIDLYSKLTTKKEK